MFMFALTALLAVGFGFMSVSRIRRSPGSRGRYLAVTGLVLGIITPSLLAQALVSRS